MGRGKPVIVLGDKTDHGGTVIEGDPTSTVAGKPIARLGDKVSCPKCKGTFPIIEGVSDTWYADKPVAIHGHKTSCGATLIGSQTLLTVSVEPGNAKSAPDSAEGTSGGSAVSPSTAAASSASSPSADQRQTYATCFQCVDDVTGQPVPGRAYLITRADGSMQSGKTDADGYTEVIEGDEDEAVSVHFHFSAPAKLLEVADL